MAAAPPMVERVGQLYNQFSSWAGSKLHSLEDAIVERLQPWNPSRIGDLTGKVALVTGTTSGIGYEVARKLLENNARVIMVVRNVESAKEALKRMRDESRVKHGHVDILYCDLSSLRKVQALIDEVKRVTKRLDILVAMAGTAYPSSYMQTEDGIEQTLAVNYYSHALLTLGLLDLLRSTPHSRVIMMTSGFELVGRLDWDNLRGDNYSPINRSSGGLQYGTSKIFKMLLARELSARVPEVDFFAVQPGGVATPLFHKATWKYPTAALMKATVPYLGQSPRRGAYSTLYAATEPALTGRHFVFIGPTLINTGMVDERVPGNSYIRNPVTCWRFTEETHKILCEILGADAVPPLPPRPAPAVHPPTGKTPFTGAHPHLGNTGAIKSSGADVYFDASVHDGTAARAVNDVQSTPVVAGTA